MFIDVHTHLYPESVYKDPLAWAAPRKENYWLKCVAPEQGPKLQGWATPDAMLRDMDEAEIEKAIVLGWYWERSETCIENIKWQAAWIKSHPDRLIAFAPFNANGGKEAVEAIKNAFGMGFGGIGELNPPAQGYGYENEYLEQALQLASEYGAVANFHVTDPDTRDYPGKIETPIESLIDLAQKHPKTNFIFAHLAGMMKLSELKKIPNIFLDTAAAPLLYKSNIYDEAIQEIGADRLLFGTDYPLRTYPKQQKKPDFITHLNDIQNADIGNETTRRILYQNAKAIGI